MSVLIFGCGYLGMRVAEACKLLGVPVHAITRNPQRARDLQLRGYHPIIANVLQPDTLHLPSVESVVYAVGHDSTAGVTMRDVYVQGLANVLEKLPPAQRFVYVSSTGVYGQTGGEEIDETAATEPIEESGQIVLEAERHLMQKLPTAVRLRFAGIYGPGRLLRQKALAAGELLPGDKENWLNLIQVGDGVRAVLAALHQAEPGEVYNVADDRPVRRREFFQQLALTLQAPPPKFGPAPGGRVANRRILNGRLHKQLGVELEYPSFVEGLAAARRSSL